MEEFKDEWCDVCETKYRLNYELEMLSESVVVYKSGTAKPGFQLDLLFNSIMLHQRLFLEILFLGSNAGSVCIGLARKLASASNDES